MCHVLGKFFRYINLTNCVHELNKSRGSEMHWVGRGGCPQRDNTLHVMGCTYRYARVFFSFLFLRLTEVFFRIAKKRIYG